VVAPVEDGQNLAYITSYIAALAPNSFISWVPGLCDGYYVCGRAWVGGVNSTPVRIELDPALYDIYVNTVGISVLVHEAAHARQWFKYGSNIITANEGYTGLVGTIAVERMADCATIVKLGYSTNVYTSSCTPSELEAAATIW
jgi:predicted SprT family Zn-dependent metalloprotease